jgi:hypothetical protein
MMVSSKMCFPKEATKNLFRNLLFNGLWRPVWRSVYTFAVYVLGEGNSIPDDLLVLIEAARAG